MSEGRTAHPRPFTRQAVGLPFSALLAPHRRPGLAPCHVHLSEPCRRRHVFPRSKDRDRLRMADNARSALDGAISYYPQNFVEDDAPLPLISFEHCKDLISTNRYHTASEIDSSRWHLRVTGSDCDPSRFNCLLPISF